MQRVTSRKSWLIRCLFLGVYFIFFAVQVHLRYALLPLQDIGSKAAIAKQTGKASKSLEQKTSSDKHARPEAKLNKRFYPTPVFESIPLHYNLQQELIVLQKQILALTPSLSSTLTICLLLRGPPSGC